MAGRRFDVLFLDFYGTVTAGDRQAVEEAARQVVDDLGISMSAERFAVAWGDQFFAMADASNHDRFRTLLQLECDSLLATLGSLGIDGVDPRPYVRRLEAYWSNPTLQPEAAEVLASLSLPICCVSNADTAGLLAAIQRHDLPIDRMVTSEQVHSYKPEPAIFARALEMMGARPDRVIHAGDSLHADVGGAAPLGITTAWVCRRQRIHDIGSRIPDHKLSCLKELRDLIG